MIRLECAELETGAGLPSHVLFRWAEQNVAGQAPPHTRARA